VTAQPITARGVHRRPSPVSRWERQICSGSIGWSKKHVNAESFRGLVSLTTGRWNASQAGVPRKRTRATSSGVTTSLDRYVPRPVLEEYGAVEKLKRLGVEAHCLDLPEAAFLGRQD
jgi:hypothetical protein